MAGSKSLFLWNVLWGVDSKLDGALTSSRQNKKVFKVNGSFIVPNGVNKLYITAISSGAAGVNGPSMVGAAGGRGGDAGDLIKGCFDVTPGTSIPVTVGDGNTIVGSLFSLVKGGANDIFDKSKPLRSGSGGGSAGVASGGGVGGAGGVGGNGLAYVDSNTILKGESGGIGGGNYGPIPGGVGYGAGGGGGCGAGSTPVPAPAGLGGAGAPGIVIIEW